MVEMQSARLKRAGVARHLLEARDFSRVRLHSNRTDIEIAIQLVSQLTEIAPCYYVTGNHEAWIKEQYLELEKGLIAEDVVILHDNVIRLTKGSDTNLGRI